MKYKLEKLPKKLSALIMLALADFNELIKLDHFEINMRNWYRRSNSTCYICLAGAIIAKRTKNADLTKLGNPFESYEVGPSDYCGSFDKIAWSLDNLRSGHLESGFDYYYDFPYPKKVQEFYMKNKDILQPLYDGEESAKDPVAITNRLTHLAEKLAEAGL